MTNLQSQGLDIHLLRTLDLPQFHIIFQVEETFLVWGGGRELSLYWSMTSCNCTTYTYRIVPNFRGAKCLRIGLLKHFTEINFADQRFLMAVPVFRNISCSLIFAVQEESAKNCENYAPRKFGAIQWFLY